jgi:hypothetical protein
MLQPYFSKAAVIRSEPMILGQIEKFLGILRKAADEEGNESILLSEELWSS